MDIIENFLLNFNSNSTRRSYRCHINNYFKIIGVDNHNDYFNNGRNYENDVKMFAQSLQQKPPLTQKTMIACIRTFLSENEVDLKSKTWRHINKRIQGRKPVTENTRPTNEELKRILTHADIKSKALFLLISSSGMRIGETLQLTFDDVDINNRTINIPGALTKNGDKCKTFFTEEAKDALNEWLSIRNKFLQRGLYKSKYVREMFAQKGIMIEKVGMKSNNTIWKITKDGKTISNLALIREEKRIFPFSNVNAIRMWNLLLEKSGLNQKETDSRLKHPRYKFHIHTLRKFFTTNFENAKVPKSYIDKYVNHTEQFNGAYTPVRTDELKEVYDKHCGCLNIFTQQTIVIDESAVVKEQRKQIADLQEQVEILMEHYKELQAQP